MRAAIDFSQLELGYDIPAIPGMSEEDIQTPCLVVDLDPLERNLLKMASYVRSKGIKLRAHGKMHKCVEVARLQQEVGGATGLCCQKVSEAEAFVRGGITDILITNQVRDEVKIDRLAALAASGAAIGCCVDDLDNVGELSRAALKHATQITCLVEIDCGAGRCGVKGEQEGVDIAKAITEAKGLRFGGVQAYQGNLQHVYDYSQRAQLASRSIEFTRQCVAALLAAGLDCDAITGGGTGSFQFEAESGLYTELQCGSYAFMDADYGDVLDSEGRRLDQDHFENALFLLTSIISTASPGQAVCDAGLKVQSVDSGLPVIFGRSDVVYKACADEHGVISDSEGVLAINEKLKLIPGHCDPTCNIHDWYVAVRNGKVLEVWPIEARGRAF